jgi:hypothetical protein
MKVFRTTLPIHAPLGQLRTTGVFSGSSLFGSCNGVNCGLQLVSLILWTALQLEVEMDQAPMGQALTFR